MKIDWTGFRIWLTMRIEAAFVVVVIIGGALLFWLAFKPH